MYFKLAWRNIWRNRRRTLITAASVFVAVILSVVMRSAQLGSYQRMIDNVVSFYSGHIQLHQKGYWEEQTLDNSFAPNDTINSILREQSDIVNWVPRLESFALASSRDLTKGTVVVGTEPKSEDALTHLSKRIISGNYLSENDDAILVSEGLAEYLRVKVNDTLVLLGQGYHGFSAAGQYRIKGILKFPSPELNNGMVYLSIRAAQEMYGTGNRLTSIALSIKPNQEASLIATELKKKLETMPFEVMDWREMMPEMVQLIAVDNAGGIITISILYMIIAFGIFGTMLMMLAERQHEFGILVAIGMKKIQLALIVVLELLMIAGIGVIAGIAGGFPIITYFYLHPLRVSGELVTAYERFGMEPVFPFSNDQSIYLSQAGIVFALTAILSLYPWFRIITLKTIKALKS